MTGVPSILARIVEAKHDEVRRRRAERPRAALEEAIAALDAPRNFRGALVARAERGNPAIVAEFKRASPSAGWIRRDADAAAIARGYQQGGAACLSVLTDVEYFGGSDADLQAARAACDLPVLRKDFIVDAWQVYETRALGADALLLIVAALDDSRLAEFSALGRELGLAVLVEVHDTGEMARALAVPGELVGINNRDLHRFVTRLETSEELAPGVPADRLVVAESGIAGPADVERLRRAGISAFLVGETLMRGGDPAGGVRALLGR
jgi:indole-3-glycerol phosphate synthase